MRNTGKKTTHFAAAVLLLLLTCRAVPAFAGDSNLEIAAIPETSATVTKYHTVAAHAGASTADKIPEVSSGSSSSEYYCAVSTNGATNSSSHYSTQNITAGGAAPASANHATNQSFAFGTCQYTQNEKPVSSPIADGDTASGNNHITNEIPETENGPESGEEPDSGEQPGNSNEFGVVSNESSSNAASGAASTFPAAYLMSYAKTITLQQHLADLRKANADSGVWFRTHGGKFEPAANNFVRDFDMKYGGILAGYDRKASGPDGALYIGAMFGCGKGDIKYLYRGKVEVDSKTVGIYASYSRADGAYADLTLKYQWLDNRLGAHDTAGGIVTGNNVRTSGPGASLEMGRRIPINAREKLGWYLEPHAQLSYSRQSGGAFRASNGLNISVDGFTSLIGRAGISIGYDDGRTNFYFKAAREKEFEGDINIIAGGERISEDFGGSRWLFGIGLTSKLNDRNSVYLTLDRAKGDSFSRPWAISAGWSITL